MANLLQVINLCLLGNLSSAAFSNSFFLDIIRLSNSLDPDQGRQNVGPDLGPNCL